MWAVFVDVELRDHSIKVGSSRGQLPLDLCFVLPHEVFAIVRRAPKFDEMFVSCIAIIDLGLVLEFDSALPIRWCLSKHLWSMEFPSIVGNEVFPNKGIFLIPANSV